MSSLSYSIHNNSISPDINFLTNILSCSFRLFRAKDCPFLSLYRFIMSIRMVSLFIVQTTKVQNRHEIRTNPCFHITKPIWVIRDITREACFSLKHPHIYFKIWYGSQNHNLEKYYFLSYIMRGFPSRNLLLNTSQNMVRIIIISRT